MTPPVDLAAVREIGLSFGDAVRKMAGNEETRWQNTLVVYVSRAKLVEETINTMAEEIEALRKDLETLHAVATVARAYMRTPVMSNEAALKAENARLCESLRDAYRFIISHHRTPFYGDGACSLCYPHAVIPDRFIGFRCEYHIALNYSPDLGAPAGGRK